MGRSRRRRVAPCRAARLRRSVGMTRAEQFAASFAHRTTRCPARRFGCGLGQPRQRDRRGRGLLGHQRVDTAQIYASIRFIFRHAQPAPQQLLLGMGQGKICARMRWNALDSGTFWAQSRSDRKSGVATTRKNWWAGTGLNRRHKDFQSCALPTELPAHQTREDNRRA